MNYVEELESGFDANGQLAARTETDMAAWRIADHLRREELKAQFRRRTSFGLSAQMSQSPQTEPKPEPPEAH